MPSLPTNNALSAQLFRFDGTSGTWRRTDGDLFPSLNRGFLYGDGTFDTWLVYEGRVVEGEAHLEKLKAAASVLGLALDESVVHQAFELVDGYKDLYIARIYVVANGGAGFGKRVMDSLYGLWLEQLAPTLTKGLRVVTSPNPIDGHATVHRHKTLAGLTYVEAVRYALGQGRGDALLVNQQGMVASLTSSCLVMGEGDRVFLPQLEDGTHNGAMRQAFLREAGMACRIQSIARKSLTTNSWMLSLNSLRAHWVAELDEVKLAYPPAKAWQVVREIYPHLDGDFSANPVQDVGFAEG